MDFTNQHTKFYLYAVAILTWTRVKYICVSLNELLREFFETFYKETKSN